MAEQQSVRRLRLRERHGAVSLRAVSGFPTAEYRANRVRVSGTPTPLASPHLVADFDDVSLDRARGITDSIGLRLRHSDFDLHKSLAPESSFAKIIFDILEQMRCEALAPDEYLGIRRNVEKNFLGWCQHVHAEGMADSELGILLYTVIHMVRARLMGTIEDESAEALIESTRANLGPALGKYLKGMQNLIHDQASYAVPARAISETVDAMIDSADLSIDDSDSAKERHSIVLPPDWNDDENFDEVESASAGQSSVLDEQLHLAGGYDVFTTEYDCEVLSKSLYRPAKIQSLRQQLDLAVSAQALSVSKLAYALQNLFADPATDGWLFGQEEGLVDARRLSQLVSNPSYSHVFKQALVMPRCNSVVSFLIDNSGSMKRQRYAAVATLVDTYCRSLQLAGVATEVLGFTTAEWNGGRAMVDWRRAGMPENPGRLGETMHVIYKDADTTWRRARPGLACLMATEHFREGIDGEALIWAYRRLQKRPEKNRYLVVISDGAPMDSASRNANDEGFLPQHLQSVAAHIHQRGEVRLGGIGIDLDLSDMYPNSVASDLNGTLGQASYHLLHELFLHQSRA